jgi:predicted house-cleaning noncanonical NTP pyrophosphatase (MazG superfamily)
MKWAIKYLIIMPMVSVFGYTSTQLCGDLVLILKPFLSDLESEFLKGLQAETGVEIVVDNVDEIVSFSGDFLSISRANEIISQFTKQLNETICENIEDKAPETCITTEISMLKHHTNSLNSDTVQESGVERYSPMPQMYVKEKHNHNTVSKDLQGENKHTYSLRKVTPKFNIKSIFEKCDLDLEDEQEDEGMLQNSDGSDVEYKPDVTDIEQNICIQDTNVLSTEINIKTYPLINSFKVENTDHFKEDLDIDSNDIPDSPKPDRINFDGRDEVVYNWKKEIGKIIIQNENDQIMAKANCKFCAYTNFLQYDRSKRELKNHHRRKHVIRDLIYNCEICNKKFAVRRDLNSHMQEHERKTCEICGKSIVRRTFSCHARRHREGFIANTHECEICLKKYPSRYRLQIHKNQMHTDQREMFPCEICKKLLSTKCSLLGHMKSVHKINEDNFTCEYCGKHFNNAKRFRYHKRQHDYSYKKTQFTCNLCNKVLFSEGGLNFHMKSHANEKDHLCAFCGKSFIQACSLQRHILIHTGEKPFGCNVCSRKFNDASILRRHMISIHRRTAENWKH